MKNAPKVLMFGWEFAPMYAGGLGVVTKGLTKGLVDKGAKVTFVIPKKLKDIKTHIKLVSAEEFGMRTRIVNSLITPYMSKEEYRMAFKKSKGSSLYGRELFKEVERFADIAKRIAAEEEHDIIHAHDWMTFKAGINAKKVSKKPLVVHVHTVEDDRTGGHGVNPYVYSIEKEAFESADKIITVSGYTKGKVINHYGINPSKIEVVHNAIEFDGSNAEIENSVSEGILGERIVLYLGRLTLQKGPGYFIDAAKKVLEINPDVKFVVAGGGDMETAMIEKAAHYGIGDKVLFTGPVDREDANRLFKMADVYVMPSVSEPFGLTPLEAINNGTPVIISKNAGVLEKLRNVFTVDFWDTHEIANKIIGLLNYKELNAEMVAHSTKELEKFNWSDSAHKCIEIYNELIK